MIYEGHDLPKNSFNLNPKENDQPEKSFTGSLTQNGKFLKAVEAYKKEGQKPEIVKVYEKIRGGIWSYNGFFELVDGWIENDGTRNVFKFKLVAIDGESLENLDGNLHDRRRIIPTTIKLEVWKRDSGKCVICGASDELHFDHILPYSKGGTSVKMENVQILCARHNLEKRDKII